MKINIYDNKEKLYDDVYQLYQKRLGENPQVILGLATGTTPLPLYKRLIKGYQKNELSFHHVTAFNLDEYVGLAKNHPASYAYFMKEKLFDHIDIEMKQTHIPDGTLREEEAIMAFQKELDSFQIDLQLLGLGANGHIGFNEPGTPFESHTHLIALTEKTRKDNSRLFNAIDEVPTHAITMGIKDIMRAKEIVLIATGKNKAQAVLGMVKGNIDESLPASILQKHPNVKIFLDIDAASLIK